MLEVKCPVCNTSFEVGSGDKPTIDPRTVNGVSYLVPKKICCNSTAEMWERAQKLASSRYEEENNRSWEEADKYEREDYVHSEFEKLNNQKGDKNMVMNKKDARMQALKEMGIDVDAMFNSGIDISKFMSKETVEETKSYIGNKRLFKRFVAAQYIRLLDWYDGPKDDDKWTHNFNKNYSYDYIMDFTADNLHRMSKLTYDVERHIEENFFDKNIVLALMEDYCQKLKAWLLTWRTKKCLGKDYIKYHGEDVFVEHIERKIISPLRAIIKIAMKTKSYAELEKVFRQFMKSRTYRRLPNDTKKPDFWVDAYKGRGAFFTAQNLIRFSGVRVNNSSLEDSETALFDKMKEYKGEYWKLHGWVKQLIRDNQFALKDVIKQK